MALPLLPPIPLLPVCVCARVSNRERKELENQIARLQDDLKAARKGKGGGITTSSSSGAEIDRLSDENRRLKEENTKLNKELQAFDLDFFEEIEDLKFKYNQAVRKLEMYEGGIGR